MSVGDTEIEIRFKLSEEGFLSLKEKLSKIAEFNRKSIQKDEYFSPSHRDFLDAPFVKEWLSIRRRDNNATLNYKNWHVPKNADSGTHCDEFETTVSNPEQLEKVLSILNMRKLAAVEKERDIYTFKDEFEIALDDVKGLGFFIEIETVKDFGSVETARDKLFEFARMIGLDISNPEKIGYVHQLLKKKGLLKSPG